MHARFFSLAVSCLGACDSSGDAGPAPAASFYVPPEEKPVDRLALGELEPGKESAYGLALPRGVRIIHRSKGALHAKGPLRPEDVANYVRKRVSTHHVELGAAGTIFPRVRIKGGDPNKYYRIIVTPVGRRETKLEVRDVTPPPTVRGLSEAERWRRAGFNPDGTLRKPNELE